jgi:hypothetical protein
MPLPFVGQILIDLLARGGDSGADILGSAMSQIGDCVQSLAFAT